MFKMKMSLIVVLSFFLLQNAMSQGLERMLDTAKQWNVLLGTFSPFGSGYGTQSLKIIGDTIIDGKICKKIGVTYIPTSPYALYSPIMYEDSSGTIFGIIYNSQNQTYVQEVMYNFNLNVGDTITPYSEWESPYGETFEVLEVDSFFFAEKYRKRISLGFMGSTDTTEYWYEGVGSSMGLIYPGCLIIDLGFDLLCFYENDTLLYNYNIFGNYSCWITVSTPLFPLGEMEIFGPNPASDVIYLKENGEIEQCVIYDINGKSLISSNESTINVSGLKEGIYFIHLLTKNQNFVQKLIICRN